MHSISGRTADEVWRAAAALTVKSELPIQSSRAGDTLEVLHLGLHVEEPSQRWVVSRTPPMNPAFALIEVFWIVAGRKDAAFPTFWNRTLSRYCGTSTDMHGAYGYRLRKHGSAREFGETANWRRLERFSLPGISEVRIQALSERSEASNLLSGAVSEDLESWNRRIVRERWWSQPLIVRSLRAGFAFQDRLVSAVAASD
jgi:hypothetical protein